MFTIRYRYIYNRLTAFLGYKPGDFPVAEECAKEVLSLPMYAELEEQGIEKVAATTHEFLANHN